MKHFAKLGLAVAIAFAAGFGAAHLTAPVSAAAVPITPQYLDVVNMPVQKYVPIVTQDAMTLGVQVGAVPKHYHADANEIQYVLEGTGTEWLGDKQVDMHPGVLLVIPKGTPHGGTVIATGSMRLLVIKTPPQAPDDVHLLP
jgi:mannose-6-phosphate isomerase-like protein (cupin superfamily)